MTIELKLRTAGGWECRDETNAVLLWFKCNDARRYVTDSGVDLGREWGSARSQALKLAEQVKSREILQRG